MVASKGTPEAMIIGPSNPPAKSSKDTFLTVALTTVAVSKKLE
jgi:hypothetical protein